jgi:hypothetical protein
LIAATLAREVGPRSSVGAIRDNPSKCDAGAKPNICACDPATLNVLFPSSIRPLCLRRHNRLAAMANDALDVVCHGARPLGLSGALGRVQIALSWVLAARNLG